MRGRLPGRAGPGRRAGQARRYEAPSLSSPSSADSLTFFIMQYFLRLLRNPIRACRACPLYLRFPPAGSR